MEIGNKLKEVREEKGLSINDIEKMTKIQSRYLHAIEKGEFSLLPGTFYTRAFVKEYAIALGLDSAQILEEYSHELPSTTEDSSIEYTRMQRSKRNNDLSSKKSPVLSLLPTIIVGVLIIGVLFIIYLISSDYFSSDEKGTSTPPTSEDNGGDQVKLPPETDEEPDAQEPADDTTDENTDESTNEDTEESVNEEPELKLTEFNNDQSTYDFTYTEDKVVITFETEGQNWLEVEDGNGESLYYGTFQQSDSPMELDVSGNDQVYVRYGEPTTLSIDLNGVPLELSDDISSPTAVQQAWINMNQKQE